MQKSPELSLNQEVGGLIDTAITVLGLPNQPIVGNFGQGFKDEKRRLVGYGALVRSSGSRKMNIWSSSYQRTQEGNLQRMIVEIHASSNSDQATATFSKRNNSDLDTEGGSALQSIRDFLAELEKAQSEGTLQFIPDFD